MWFIFNMLCTLQTFPTSLPTLSTISMPQQSIMLKNEFIPVQKV